MPAFKMKKKDQKNLLRVLSRALLTKGYNVMGFEVRPAIEDDGHTITVTFYDRYWNKRRS